MSSKVIHPSAGLPITVPLEKGRGKESTAASERKKAQPRGSRAAHGAERKGVALKDEDTLSDGRQDDGRHQEPHPPGGRAIARGVGMRQALTLPRGEATNASQATGPAASGIGRERAELRRWSRIISQTSPERLAQGQAVLERHAAAVEAFARLILGLGKPR